MTDKLIQELVDLSANMPDHFDGMVFVTHFDLIEVVDIDVIYAIDGAGFNISVCDDDLVGLQAAIDKIKEL